MIEVGAIFIILVMTKVAYNTRNFLWARHYFKKYNEYGQSRGKGWYIRERKQRIIELFEKAGVKDSYGATAEPIGYMQIQTGQFSVWNG